MSDEKVVYATCTTFLLDTPDGRPAFRLVRGEQWAADDPVVKHRPDLFTDDPTSIHRTTRPVETNGGALEGDSRRRSRSPR